jgi:hypothetical protein
MDGINKFSVKEVGNLGFGQVGFEVISNTAAHVGSFYAIKAVNANAVINTAVSKVGDNLSAITILEGDIIYGNFTSITLTSGTVLAYEYGA